MYNRKGANLMVQRANYLPRTLRGAGGAKLFDIPGVIYPANMLSPNECYVRGIEPILDKVPMWGISSRAAADMLRCLPSTARTLLHRHKVRHCKVCVGPYPPAIYWDRKQVNALAVARQPVHDKVPSKFMLAKEAQALLGVSRNTIVRLVNRGLLRQYRLRLSRADGARFCNLFLKSEVRKLSGYRRAIKCSTPPPKRHDRMDIFLGQRTESTSGNDE